jgi:hypothetical protein
MNINAKPIASVDIIARLTPSIKSLSIFTEVEFRNLPNITGGLATNMIPINEINSDKKCDTFKISFKNMRANIAVTTGDIFLITVESPYVIN